MSHTMSPLVSVILPNYNHARFLRERFDSILTQTYKNIELIILDDHSTDNSLEIISDYKDCPVIKRVIVNDVNSGSPFIQWARGISLATGEIIWIAESDDTCEKTFLERVIHCFLSVEDCVLAYSSTRWINEKGNDIRTPVKYKYDSCFSAHDFIRKRLDIGTDIWNASSAIFRRSSALKIPDTYTTFKNTGDHLFWIELARTGGHVIHLNEQLNYCRQHGNNISSKKELTSNVFLEEKRIFDIQVSYGSISGLKKYHVIDRYRSMILGRITQDKEAQEQALRAWGVSSPIAFLSVKSLALLYRLFTK